MEQVRIGNRTFTILFPDLLRPLNDTELVALRKSIRKNGVVCPVIVDEEDGVIDGGNRLRIAKEVGLQNVLARLERNLTDEGKIALALELNDARRHLTPAERRKLKEDRVSRVAEKRREGKSLRTIAEEEEVSEKQVRLDIERAAAEGSAPEPEAGTTKGKDNKRYPSRRQPKPRPAPAPVEASVGTPTPPIAETPPPEALPASSEQTDLFETAMPEATHFCPHCGEDITAWFKGQTD